MKPTIGFAVILLGILFGCAPQPEPDHYFLDGYPELIFRDTSDQVVPTQFFIEDESENGSHYYNVKDPSLLLTYRKDGRPYSGYIRVFHWGIYNIEGIFKEGSIQRLRFWHPNRVLGMDQDFVTRTATVWNINGERSITWNSAERIYLYANTQQAREIQSDTISTFFDMDGTVSHYTIRRDSTNYSYFANGTPRYFSPNNISGNGIVKRWHPNGVLRAIGEYKNWQQVGVWIEYDSLGQEINREVFDSQEGSDIK